MLAPETETLIEEAFRIGPDFGLQTLHSEACEVILSYIRFNGLGLTSSDIDDVYQETMIDVFKAANSPTFDPESPMRLVFQCASRNVTDRRRRLGFRRKHERTALHDHLIEDLNGSSVGLKARYDPIDWPAFDAALREEIDNLPAVQKLAAICFCDVYVQVAESSSYASLADAMTFVLGKPVTVVAAKSAWYEAKSKLAASLKRRGFDLLSGNES